MELVNDTPFVLTRSAILDKNAAETLIVILKGTYSITEDGALYLAEEQAPVVPGDEFHGDPVGSSIERESELGPVKMATDVFLRGSAVAPRRGTTRVEVAFRLGPVVERAVVFGTRRWLNNLGSPSPSAPEPFEKIPLIWENAFGGTDLTPTDQRHHGHEPRNPVGRAFRSKNSNWQWEDDLLPNVESPVRFLEGPGQSGTPVGFGPVGRNWEPRIRYRGTYDQRYLDERVPLLPKDFDERFHNAAPPKLVVPGFLKGGEPVEVQGCTPRGWLAFFLPRLETECMVLINGQVEEMDLALNSVTVDTEVMELHLLWKAELLVHGRLQKISHIGCRSRELVP